MKKLKRKGGIYVIVLILIISAFPLFTVTPVSPTNIVKQDYDPQDENITITIISAPDINESSSGVLTYVFNISSVNTPINNESILIATGVSPNNTLVSYNWSFMIPPDVLQPNSVRCHGRGLNTWYEVRFNDSGTGELGTIGEWQAITMDNVPPSCFEITEWEWGANYTQFNFNIPADTLFPQIWYVDRYNLVNENKTDQYIPIYENNMIRTEYDVTGIPSDTTSRWDWGNATYHALFYANATSGSQPLNVYYANSSFGNEDPSTSPNAVFIGSVMPNESYEWTKLNSSYYDITYTARNLTIGTVNMTFSYYLVFTSEVEYNNAWKLYYADDNVSEDEYYHDFLNSSVADVSTNDGETWYPLGNDTIDDKVLRLEFNEGSGDNLVDHSSIFTGHYHNGTRHGATWNASGHEGSCLDFNGTTDYVNVTNDPDGHLNFTNEMTVSLWMNPTNLAPYDYWISKEDSFRFGTSNNKNRPRFGFYRSGWKQESTDSDYLFDGDIWYHVAATFNSTEPETVILYVNGTEVYRQSGFTGTGDMESGFGDIYIGTRYGITAGFEGSIDDVRLWNRTLSPDEMYDVYANITRKGTPDVNFNVGNPNVDTVLYKFYAETEDGGNGTWSQLFYDILGNTSFPPTKPIINKPANDEIYYINATENITVNLEWIGDPNYNDCYMNVTFADKNDAWIYTIANITITGDEQRNNSQYTFNFSHWGYQGNQYIIHTNISETTNASSYTHNDRNFYLTEIGNPTNLVPIDGSTDISIPVNSIQLTHNQSYGEYCNLTYFLIEEENEFTVGPFELSSNGTSLTTHSQEYWGNNYSTEYQWIASFEYEGGSPHWKNFTYTFRTEDDPRAEWTLKPGYNNCTYGVPDFDQKQDNWWGIGPGGPWNIQWSYDGPVALLNCIWWMDCKIHNATESGYNLPDFYGSGSKDPNNVIPTIDWLAGLLNTSVPAGAPGITYGTNAENMSLGINNTMNYLNLTTDDIIVEVEGLADECYNIQGVNYSNITNHLIQCHDVILLLGMYTWDPVGGFANRIGGHYVQCNGFNTSGSPQLIFCDPFYDANESGEVFGWHSLHDHLLYGNGSHNWTENVSYDGWNINITSDFADGAACEVIDYPPDMNVTNWSALNWAADCDVEESPGAFKTVIEVAWYIYQNQSMAVNKTVWNGSEWSHYHNASVGEEVTFNITIECTGGDIRDNITIFETFYDSLRYNNYTANITFSSNGTTYQRIADYDTWEDATCTYPGHGHLTWNLPQAEVDNMTLGDFIWLEFNCTLVGQNFSANTVGVYITDIEFEWWDSMHFNTSECYVHSQFTNYSCYPNPDETSNWTVSEYIGRPCSGRECLDELWNDYEGDYLRWAPYNTSVIGDADWGWVYQYNNSDILGGDANSLSYTIANDSCSNRSMGALRMRYTLLNDSTGEPFIGVVYAFENQSNFDMILVTFGGIGFASMRDGVLVNTNDSTELTNGGSIYNFGVYNWSCNATQTSEDEPDPWYDGVYLKYLYNEHSGDLSVKVWEYSNWIDEPSGWEYQGNLSSDTFPTSPIIHDEAECFGLCVWHPGDDRYCADFDYINDWRLNYTRSSNITEVENHTDLFNSTGVPLMYFKAYNDSDWVTAWNEIGDLVMDYFFFGGMSTGHYVDSVYCLYRNYTDFYNLESKYSEPGTVDCIYSDMYDNQNDTVYYYSGTHANIEDWFFKNELMISIQDTTDGEQDQYDSVIVGIDVDNNKQWDDNDWLFHWWDDDGNNDIWYNVWNGTEYNRGGDYDMMLDDLYLNIGFPNLSLYWLWLDYSYLPALHRYSGHRQYEIGIPLYYLEKGYVGSGQYLNASDVFGLHVMTIPVDNNVPTGHIAITWENYNETTNAPYMDEDAFTTWENYMNISDFNELMDFWWDEDWDGVNNNHLQYWGLGQIGTEVGTIAEHIAEVNITKESNITTVYDTSTITYVQYYINISNVGDEDVANLTVNDTFPESVTFIDCNLTAPGNVTNPYDNCYVFNVTGILTQGEEAHFVINVSIAANAASNGTVMVNFANTSSNSSTNSSANHSIYYGSNNAPQIVWTYPAGDNSSTPLLLDNLSVYVSDDDGDMMNVSFFTNKSIDDSWTPAWNSIGINTSVYNGTYNSNQTFNNTDRYNTRWRWGATWYTWYINVTDGQVWVNQTFRFKTAESRYDVYFDNTVNVFDLNTDWTYRTGAGYDYLGVYDVDGDDTINVFDLNAIWTNKS